MKPIHLVILLGSLLALIGAGVVIALRAGKPTPTASDPPAKKQEEKKTELRPPAKELPMGDPKDWTMRELMNHLETQGLKFKWWAERGLHVAIQFPQEDGTYMDVAGWKEFRKYTTLGVDVFKYDDEKKAREMAGSTKHGQHWKVFAFYGDPDDIKRVMALLPK
jgi:hypothetical protein